LVLSRFERALSFGTLEEMSLRVVLNPCTTISDNADLIVGSGMERVIYRDGLSDSKSG
jgi:hypothetical protein